MMLLKNGIHDSVIQVTEERQAGNGEPAAIQVGKTSEKKLLWVRFKPSNNGISFHGEMINSIEERGPML